MIHQLRLSFSLLTPLRTSALLLALAVSASSGPAQATTLEGMGLIKEWTDFEAGLDEMPEFIWGTSDTDGADRIGLRVTFAGGLTGSVTYSGISGLWNSTFAGRASDTATGFFTGATGLHFLFNGPRTGTLPIAWQGFVMPFSNNFDLDYTNGNNSNFRASVGGWGSAVFETFSDTAPLPIPEPGTALLLGFGLATLSARRSR